jgi:hypothetical protein
MNMLLKINRMMKNTRIHSSNTTDKWTDISFHALTIKKFLLKVSDESVLAMFSKSTSWFLIINCYMKQIHIFGRRH